jgi:hypothetical protein
MARFFADIARLNIAEFFCLIYRNQNYFNAHTKFATRPFLRKARFSIGELAVVGVYTHIGKRDIVTIIILFSLRHPAITVGKFFRT